MNSQQNSNCLLRVDTIFFWRPPLAYGSGAAGPRGLGDQGGFCSGLRVVLWWRLGGARQVDPCHQTGPPGRPRGSACSPCPLRNSRLLTSLGASLKIIAVQRQTRSGRWTRFKIFVTFGDCHLRDYHLGQSFHHPSYKVTDHCGSVLVPSEWILL